MFTEAWKLTIITEKLIEEKVARLLLSEGCKGFTVFNVGGRGLHHFHAPVERGIAPEEFSEIQIEVVVLQRSRAEAVAQKILTQFLDLYAGIVFLEKVEVLRPERF